MFRTPKALPLLLALALAPMAQAQTGGTTAPAAGGTTAAPAPDMGTPAPGAQDNSGGIGSPYVQSTSGDWDVRCVHAQDGHDPCQLYQLLKDDSGHAVAEFAISALPPGQPAVAGATIVTPLETLLTRGVELQIDSAPAKAYGFLFCNAQGCVAKVGFTAEEITAMRKGQKVGLSVIPVGAPDQPVKLTMSLKGFASGYDTVAKLNTEHGVMTAPPGAAGEPPKPKVPGLSGATKSGN